MSIGSYEDHGKRLSGFLRRFPNRSSETALFTQEHIHKAFNGPIAILGVDGNTSVFVQLSLPLIPEASFIQKLRQTGGDIDMLRSKKNLTSPDGGFMTEEDRNFLASIFEGLEIEKGQLFTPDISYYSLQQWISSQERVFELDLRFWRDFIAHLRQGGFHHLRFPQIPDLVLRYQDGNRNSVIRHGFYLGTRPKQNLNSGYLNLQGF